MISSTTRRVRYTGDGATSSYDYTFQIDNQSDLKVVVRSSASPPVEYNLTITTDYTVTGVGETGGGSIALVNSSQTWLTSGYLKSGWKIIIRGDASLLQSYDIRNQGSAYRETLEDSADRLLQYIQQLKDYIDRSVKLPETYISSDFNPTFPTDMDSGGYRVPLTNSAGDGWAAFASWPTLADVQGNNSVFYVDGTFASPNDIAGSGTITFTTGYKKNKVYIQGDSGAQTAGNIQAGVIDGQDLLLVGCSDSSTVTLDTGGRISLNGSCVLGAGNQIYLNWDHGSSLWREVSRSH